MVSAAAAATKKNHIVVLADAGPHTEKSSKRKHKRSTAMMTIADQMLKYLVIRCGNCHFGVIFFLAAAAAACVVSISPDRSQWRHVVAVLSRFFVTAICLAYQSST